MANRDAPVILVNGTPLDPADVALPLVIQHGRSGTSTQPDAPECRFEWFGETPPFQMGDTVKITLTLPTAGTMATWGDPVQTWGDPTYSWTGMALSSVDKFTGRIAHLEAVESGGNVVSWIVGCLGLQASYGRKHIDIQRPEETEIARAEAIAAAGGFPLNVMGTSTVIVLADHIQRDALSALHELASWTAALVVQGRDGSMNYGTANHRTSAPQTYFPSSGIVDGIAWDTSVDEVVNHFVVIYGSPETQNTYRDDASIAHWGFMHAEQTTKLARQQDVDEFGQTVLVRRANPFYLITDVVINSEDCSDAEYWEVNLARVSAGVLIEIPVEPGAVDVTATPWTIEGWVETWDTPSNQRLQIAVSDRQRWGAYALRKWSETTLQPWSYWVPFTWLEQLTGDNV